MTRMSSASIPSSLRRSLVVSFILVLPRGGLLGRGLLLIPKSEDAASRFKRQHTGKEAQARLGPEQVRRPVRRIRFKSVTQGQDALGKMARADACKLLAERRQGIALC